MAEQKNDGARSSEPPPSTLKALEEQTTPKLMKELMRFAQKRAQMVRHAGRPVAETYARELVDDAHADTRLGLLPWDPLQCELDKHLGRAIQKRTWDELRHAHRVSFVSLHEAANDETMPPQTARGLAHASQSSCSPIVLYVMTSTVCQQLRRLLPDDGEAAAVVACWEDGIVERDQIMTRTGLTGAAYERTRKRLLYAGRHFSSELREAAQDLLRSAS